VEGAQLNTVEYSDICACPETFITGIKLSAATQPLLYKALQQINSPPPGKVSHDNIKLIQVEAQVLSSHTHPRNESGPQY
jgi:hypothetical protein